MGDDVIVRDARLKDSREAIPLWQEFMEYHKRISTMDHEMLDNAEESWQRYFEKHVRSGIRKAIVAECDGRLVGFLLGTIEKRPPVFRNPLHAYVDSIAVTESMRNRGIGAMMMDAFEMWAKAKGMPHIMLNVVVENDGARHLYEKLGFKTMILSQRKILTRE